MKRDRQMTLLDFLMPSDVLEEQIDFFKHFLGKAHWHPDLLQLRKFEQFWFFSNFGRFNRSYFWNVSIDLVLIQNQRDL